MTPLLGRTGDVAKALAAEGDLAKLRKACGALEADLFKRFLKAATPKEGLMGKAPGSEIYDDMAQDAVAQAAASRGTLGVARSIFERMAPAVVAQHRHAPDPAPDHAPDPLAQPRKTTENTP